MLCVAGFAGATTGVAFHWAPSPTITPDGSPRPEAVCYHVWVIRDGEAEFLAATVHGDTVYELQAEAGLVYRLRVRGEDRDGNLSSWSEYSEPFAVPSVTTAPPTFGASFIKAFPNPFNPRTMFAYTVPDDLPSAAPLSLRLFDLGGRQVRSLDPDRSGGQQQAVWDGCDDEGRPLPAGIYVARYVCGAFVANTKVTLVR